MGCNLSVCQSVCCEDCRPGKNDEREAHLLPQTESTLSSHSPNGPLPGDDRVGPLRTLGGDGFVSDGAADVGLPKVANTYVTNTHVFDSANTSDGRTDAETAEGSALSSAHPSESMGQGSHDVSAGLPYSEDPEADMAQYPEPPRAGQDRRDAVDIELKDVLEGMEARFGSEAIENVGPKIDEATAAMFQKATMETVRLFSAEQFMQYLNYHGVALAEKSGDGKAKNAKDLWVEFLLRTCDLEKVKKTSGFGLKRNVRIILVEIAAMVDNEEKFLLLKDQKQDNGNHRKDLKMRLTRKMYDDEDVQSATYRCLVQMLSLSDRLIKDGLSQESAREQQETKESSTGFPGLPTHYTMHMVRMRVKDPSSQEVTCLGLPNGDDIERAAPSGLHTGGRNTYRWYNSTEFAAAVDEWKGEVAHNRTKMGRLTESLSAGLWKRG